MGLGEKNGEEFDQVKVALVPVFETNMPDEFVLGGHVVVSDNAAVPPRAELHSDVASDEMVRVRGRRRKRRVRRGRGGLPWPLPSPWGRGDCGGGKGWRDA